MNEMTEMMQCTNTNQSTEAKAQRTEESLKKQARTIRDFLVALFGPEEQVYIYPALPKDRMEVARERHEVIPEYLHNKRLKFLPHQAEGSEGNEAMKPLAFVQPFKRKASSTGTAQIEKLWAFADLGYEIFFCINPLSAPRRCQKTVQKGLNIVIESDHDDLDIQRRVLDANRSIIRAAMFTGGKSIHAFVHLTPAPANPSVVSYAEAWSLKNTRCSFRDYRAVADTLILHFKDAGLSVDEGVARDSTRVSRLPGFPHGKTGTPSEVLWINQDSSFDTRDLIHPSLLPESSDDWDNIDSSSHSTPVSIPDSLGSLFVKSEAKALTSKPKTPKGKEKAKEEKKGERKDKESITNVSGHKQSFLDDLETYEGLITNGITTRGQRRRNQISLIVTGVVMGWSKERTLEEWKTILKIGSPNIGCSVEHAVRDLETVLATQSPRNPFLPNLRAIPDMEATSSRIRAQTKIVRLPEALPERRNILRLLTLVILPKMRTLPMKAKDGCLNLLAKEMQMACVRGQYRKALDWLLANNLMEATQDFVFRQRSRAYRVNIPLVLYLFGFKTNELDWRPRKSTLKGKLYAGQEL